MVLSSKSPNDIFSLNALLVWIWCDEATRVPQFEWSYVRGKEREALLFGTFNWKLNLFPSLCIEVSPQVERTRDWAGKTIPKATQNNSGRGLNEMVNSLRLCWDKSWVNRANLKVYLSHVRPPSPESVFSGKIPIPKTTAGKLGGRHTRALVLQTLARPRTSGT